jgi:hypothetical protein
VEADEGPPLLPLSPSSLPPLVPPSAGCSSLRSTRTGRGASAKYFSLMTLWKTMGGQR